MDPMAAPADLHPCRRTPWAQTREPPEQRPRDWASPLEHGQGKKSTAPGSLLGLDPQTGSLMTQKTPWPADPIQGRSVVTSEFNQLFGGNL